MSDERITVPDGDPCPEHGLPTRLLFLVGAGLLSQCDGCREAFLRWFAEHTRGTDLSPRPLPAAKRDQLDLGVSA